MGHSGLSKREKRDFYQSKAEAYDKKEQQLTLKLANKKRDVENLRRNLRTVRKLMEVEKVGDTGPLSQ